MADEADSKSVVRKGVWVRIPLPAPELGARICAFFIVRTPIVIKSSVTVIYFCH